VPRPQQHRYANRITPDILADDVRLGDAIDKVLLADETLQRAHRQVVRRQRALRKAVTDEHWYLYMAIEELVNGSHATAVSIVARAFYGAGRRAGRRRK
jgi:hypothetical protein